MESYKQYTDIYSQHRDLVDNGSCQVMNLQRETAANLLREQGLPTHKVERYKYTDANEAFAPDLTYYVSLWMSIRMLRLNVTCPT